MTPFVGQIVWLCLWDTKGPLAAVVSAVRGTTVDATVFWPNTTQSLTDITPWDVEDGTYWGWLPIPADGIIPPDLFA